MSLEAFLLLLRLVSSILLLLLLYAILAMLRKDHRDAIRQSESGQRVYGKLTAGEEINGAFTPTGITHPLRPLTNLGRAPTNNVVIEDSFASSEHAQITFRDGQWWLDDRNSRNGTTLNGTLIHQSVVIANGDVIGIGQKLFRLDLE